MVAAACKRQKLIESVTALLYRIEVPTVLQSLFTQFMSLSGTVNVIVETSCRGSLSSNYDHISCLSLLQHI